MRELRGNKRNREWVRGRSGGNRKGSMESSARSTGNSPIHLLVTFSIPTHGPHIFSMSMQPKLGKKFLMKGIRRRPATVLNSLVNSIGKICLHVSMWILQDYRYANCYKTEFTNCAWKVKWNTIVNNRRWKLRLARLLSISRPHQDYAPSTASKWFLLRQVLFRRSDWILLRHFCGPVSTGHAPLKVKSMNFVKPKARKPTNMRWYGIWCVSDA